MFDEIPISIIKLPGGLFQTFTINSQYFNNYTFSVSATINNGKKVSLESEGTMNVFSDIRVLSIQTYVHSLSCLPMGINLVQDKGPRNLSKLHFVHHKR